MIKQPINNFKVKPLDLPKDNRLVKGKFMFAKPYCTVYLVGKKNSGKTVTLFNIMCNRIETNTTVVIFSSTLYCDDTWIAIRKWLHDKGIPTMLHTSLIEDGVNALEELYMQLEDEAKARDEAKQNKKEKKHKPIAAIKTDDDDDEEDEKEKKPKYLASDWLIILDDMSSEIKNKSLEVLIKKHRHHKSTILIANQTLNDLAVASRKNIDYWILFRDLDQKKLLEIYSKCSFGVKFPQFESMYLDATKMPFGFFYFDCNTTDFRANFNLRYKTKNKLK